MADSAQFPVITPRQEEALSFVLKYHADNGLPPSMREIAAGLGIGKTNPTPYLAALIRAGYLTKSQIPTRNLIITDLARRWFASMPQGGDPAAPLSQTDFERQLFTRTRTRE